MLLLYGLLIGALPLIETRLGIFIPIGGPSGRELALLGAVVLAGTVAGALPAYRAYRLSLADGLSLRL